MTAMQLLDRCRRAAHDILRIDDRMARLRECAEKVTSCLGQMGGGSGISDKALAFVEQLEACRIERDERERAYECELLAACEIVDRLPELTGGILYRYYVNGQSLKYIADALGYTRPYVRQKKTEGDRRITRVGNVDAMLPDWYRELHT